MKPSTEEIARQLRAERDLPSPEFARALDEWAAAGFPRGEGPLASRRQPGRLRALAERISAVPPRRLLAPAGAAATLAVVAAVAIGQSGEFGGGDGASPQGVSPGGPAAELPVAGATPTAPEALPERRAPAPAVSDEAVAGGGVAPSTILPPVPGPGGIAGGRSDRVVERSATLTIGAESGEVPDVADEVIAVAKANGGIVVSSQVTTGEGDARASFDLAIPSDRLQAALTALSELGHVISMNEGSLDITGPTVSARRRLERAEGRLEALQARLAEATAVGDAEAEARIRRRIRETGFQAGAARAELRQLQGRARFARVSVTVTSEGEAGGEWSLGDALDDAGRVLTVAAGVALVSAAVLLPIALLSTLAALAWRATARHRRDRVLDSVS